jgi:hypothetical protein
MVRRMNILILCDKMQCEWFVGTNFSDNLIAPILRVKTGNSIKIALIASVVENSVRYFGQKKKLSDIHCIKVHPENNIKFLLVESQNSRIITLEESEKGLTDGKD